MGAALEPRCCWPPLLAHCRRPRTLRLPCCTAQPPSHPFPAPTRDTRAVNQTADKAYYFFDGYAHFAAGLACGLAGLGAGMAIGIVGDAGVRANAQQPKLFVGMILILIFAEALALYGLIGARVQRGGQALQEPLAWEGDGSAGCAAAPAQPAARSCPTPDPTPAVGIILASKAGTAVPMS